MGSGESEKTNTQFYLTAGAPHDTVKKRFGICRNLADLHSECGCGFAEFLPGLGNLLIAGTEGLLSPTHQESNGALSG